MSFNNWFESEPNTVSVRELGEFIYVFFDNMRCVKLSVDGKVVWDKYFYTWNARVKDVLMTTNGEFIMVGTRKLRMNSTDDELKTDVLCIKINADGFRVGW